MSGTTRPDGLPVLVEVKVDPEFHGGAQPVGEIQRLTWEVLDTVWSLMREYAVRVTLAEIREQLSERGEDFPSDEELLKRVEEESGKPTTYLDLAPSTEIAGLGIQTSFDVLVAEAFGDAAREMGFVVDEPTE